MISLCMIVKDPWVFGKCLESVGATGTLRKVPLIDEVIIVSENYDVEKVCKSKNWKFYYYKWKDDFADARNFSFSKASNDIILWLDDDDIVLHPENLPKLAKLIEDKKCDWIHLEYLYEKDEFGNVRLRQWKPRLMRKGTGIWKKSVHEVFEPTTEVGQILSDDVVIDHQHTGEPHSKESGERNLKILMAEYTKDREKTDPRTLYYLGNTLMGLGRHAEAIPFYSAHIKVCGWPEEKYFSMHYLAHCFKEVGQLEPAINVALESTKLFPNWSLAYFNLAEFYSMKEDHLRTIEWTMTGLTKDRPDSKAYFTSDLDYTVNPMGRLAIAYLSVHEYDQAYKIAERLVQENPKDPHQAELLKLCKDALDLENFVRSFISTVSTISNLDRIKATKMFDALPSNLENDVRIQEARFTIVPPKTWEAKSIVIYCHGGLEEWGPPSLYTGLGGSEEAVVHMGNQLIALGYKVTVYNRCGSYQGTYKGVEYKPYYHFDRRDNFDTLIIWRYPGFYNDQLKAKRKYLWLHDIVGPTLFNDKIINQVDKVFFLSRWHRDNLPDLPEEKVFITNNGIDPKEFEGEIKKRPSSLVWTSSYDRGLLPFLKNIYPLIQKEIPDVTLDVCYGWDNIKKEMESIPHLKKLYEELPALLNQPSVTHHGRIGHKQVAELLKSSMVMPYASEFGETNNISSQKAQAAGCYVITTSQSGGTPERIRFGAVVAFDNIYTDKKAQEAFAKRTVLALKESWLNKIPQERLGKIREEFSWTKTASQWKELIND